MKKHKLLAIVLVLLVVLVGWASPCLTTATLCGRWLLWQDADVEDHKLFPFREIANDPTQVFQFKTRETPDYLTKYAVAGEPLEQFLAKKQTGAFIVIQNDHILWEKYFNGYKRGTINTSFSMAKSFLSALVGIAIKEQLIGSVDDPITQYLPELKLRFDAVTIQHLLTMTSGIQKNIAKVFGVEMPWSDEIKTYYGPGLRKIALAATLQNPPGTKWQYNDYNALLLGLILERATKASVSKYLEEKIWKIVGMEFPASWSLDSESSGFEKMESGLNARAIDYARFGRLFLNQGNWDGTQVIPETWVSDSTLNQDSNSLFTKLIQSVAEKQASPQKSSQVAALRYQYMWWGYERDGRYDFYANGFRGQFIYVSPAHKVIIVRTGIDTGGYEDQEWANFFFGLIDEIARKS